MRDLTEENVADAVAERSNDGAVKVRLRDRFIDDIGLRPASRCLTALRNVR